MKAASWLVQLLTRSVLTKFLSVGEFDVAAKWQNPGSKVEVSLKSERVSGDWGYRIQTRLLRSLGVGPTCRMGFGR